MLLFLLSKYYYYNVLCIYIVVICMQAFIYLLSFIVSLNSIYLQISIYTWQHTSIQIHGKWIRKQVTCHLLLISFTIFTLT